jgi:hypothetical protein
MFIADELLRSWHPLGVRCSEFSTFRWYRGGDNIEPSMSINISLLVNGDKWAVDYLSTLHPSVAKTLSRVPCLLHFRT